MRPQVLHVFLRHAMMVTDEREITERTKQIKDETVKLLCVICTVKTNRHYIPGETNLVERMRKEAFDKGIFATLTYIYKNITAAKSANLKKYIKEKVLNLIELNDLVYHAHVADVLIDILKKDPSAFQKEEQNSVLTIEEP